MSTFLLPCGCLVDRSMFGKREIMGVHVCMHHYQHSDVQYALVALANAVKVASDDFPVETVKYKGPPGTFVVGEKGD